MHVRVKAENMTLYMNSLVQYHRLGSSWIVHDGTWLARIQLETDKAEYCSQER